MHIKIDFTWIGKFVLSAVITALFIYSTTFSLYAAVLPVLENMETEASAVDYSNVGNWAYLSIGDKEVDLFLIYPTVYRSDSA